MASLPIAAAQPVSLDFDELAGWTARQRAACDAADGHRFTLYGGARGPGKSYWLRWYLLLELLRLSDMGFSQPQVGLFCEDYPSLRDRQIVKIKGEFPDWMGEVRDSQISGLGFYLHKDYGGGGILLRNLDDASKYQSSEFAAIGVDELTKNSLETFNLLRGSLRWPGLKRPKFVAGTNPGSVGHAWVYRYWMEKDFPPEMEGLRNEFVYVPGLPDDNPHLDESYWKMLETLPPELAKAWRWGDWSVFSGQVFTEFRAEAHVVEPFEIPKHWVKWRGIDWGYAKPFACVWLTRDPDTERVYVYREVYEKELTTTVQARTVRDNTPKDEVIVRTYADPSMWERIEEKVGEVTKVTTYATIYAGEGVPLVKANNDRLGGLRKIHDMLANAPDGKPKMQIFKNCTNLIRTLPILPYDRIRVEDVDSKSDDHSYDSLRYSLSDTEIKASEVVEDHTLDNYKQAMRAWMGAKV